MPLRSPERKQRQAHALRRRIDALTHHDPSISSSSATENDGAWEWATANAADARSALYQNQNQNPNRQYQDPDDIALEAARERRSLSLSSSVPGPLLDPDVGPSPAFRKRHRVPPRRHNQDLTYAPNIQMVPTPPTSEQLSYNTIHGRDQKQSSKPLPRIALGERDFEILEIIAAMADKATASIDPPPSESLSFSHLYGAFEAFMTANNFDQHTYPAYHSMFMALLHLTSYANANATFAATDVVHHRTWHDCVLLFVKMYSDKELFRAKMQSLRDKLRAFEDDMRERFLALWYDSYIKLTESNAHLSLIADSHRQVSLPHSVLSVWIRKHRMLTHNTAKADHGKEYIAKYNMFSRWRNRLLEVRDDDEVAGEIQTRKMVQKWGLRAKKAATDENHAEEMHSFRLARSIFGEWHQATAESLASNEYHVRLATTVFAQWKEKTARILEREDGVAERDSAVLASSFLDIMLARRYRNDVEYPDQADNLYLSIIATRHFGAWKRALDFKRKLETLEDSQNQRLLRSVFGEWDRRTLESCEARNFSVSMPCRRMLKVWKLKMSLVKVVRSKNVALVGDALKTWRLKTRETAFVRRQNTRVAESVLEHWYTASESQRHDLADREQEFIDRRMSAQASTLFNTWRAKSSVLPGMTATAEQFYGAQIATRSLDLLLVRYDRNSEMQTLAEAMDVKTVLNRGIERWKLAFVLSRRRRREALLEDFVSARDSRLKRSILYAWEDRFDDSRDIEARADDLLTKKNHALTAKLFGAWATRGRRNLANQSLSEKMDEDSALHKYFTVYRSRFAETQALAVEGVNFKQELTTQSVDQIFRVWRIRLTKIGFKQRSAGAFFERVETARKKAIWKNWKAVTGQQRLQQADEEVVGAAERQMRQLAVEEQELRQQDSPSRRRRASSTATTMGPFSTVPRLNPPPALYTFPSISNNTGAAFEIIHPAVSPSPPPVYDMTSPTLRAAAATTARRRTVQGQGQVTPPGAAAGSGYPLETPTRSRTRRPVPMTSISRWKLSMKTMAPANAPPPPPPFVNAPGRHNSDGAGAASSRVVDSDL